MRIGVIHQVNGLGTGAAEQLLGVRLAAGHTREASHVAPKLELVERPFGDDAQLPHRLDELLGNADCDALLGILPVPLSVQAAASCEARGVLYATGNNNPKVGEGRRNVFHIGVPSEITADGTMAYLRGERGVQRLAVLHTPGEFQAHAARCIADAATELGVLSGLVDIGLTGDADVHVAQAIEAHQADAVCVMGSEVGRLIDLAPALNRLAGRPRVLLSRGMVCREFAERCAADGEGYDFIDLFLRSTDASSEELALMNRLASTDGGLITTASHGFGWDCLRLLAAALANGSDLGDQIAYLESAGPIVGATGVLRFSSTDHNGHWHDDPTTIVRLTDGRFTPVSRLAR